MTQHDPSLATPLEDDDDWKRREREREQRKRRKKRRYATVAPNDRVMRLREVEQTVGLKKSAIYAGIQGETFPSPVPLGEKAVGWLASEIFDWLAERIAARDRRNAA